MNPNSDRNGRPFGAGWAVLACLLALPWLLETHVEPWTMFYADWLLAGVAWGLSVWVLSHSPAGLPITALPLGLAVLSMVPLLQAAGGLTAFPTEGAVAALYLTGFTLAVMAGCRSETLAPGLASDALLAGLAIAGIASTGLQLYQWLELNFLGVLVRDLPPLSRPFANLGQPNLLATLQVWGVIAMWWAYERKAIGPTGALFGTGFLLLGVVVTQSRAAWVELAFVSLMALARLPAMKRHLPRATVLAVVVCFATLVLFWPMLGSLFGQDPLRTLVDQVAAGKRPAIWRLGLDAIAARPWLGWGWGQGGEAHVALAAEHASIQALTSYMHNLALDLMVWSGIPVGVLAVLGLAAWYAWRWGDRGSAEQRLLLVAIGTLLIHAMLELPHGYALFLLPAGLMMGTVEARSSARFLFVLPRWAAAVALGLAAVALVMLFGEKQAVEHDMMDMRMRAARIANLPPLGPPPRLRWMAPFGELLANLRIEPVAGMSSASLDSFQRVAYHYPSTGNLLRLAEADVLNGRNVQARDALALLCDLRPAPECDRAGRYWKERGHSRYPELAANWPVVPSVAGLASPIKGGTSQ